MQNHIRLEETIVALATANQPAGLGVIRVSGPRAIEVVELYFRAKHGEKSLKDYPSYRFCHGWLEQKQQPIDEVLIVIMRAPRSYTAEDVVEIHCHGSPLVCKTILDLLLQQEVRLANPGEFTQRAFLNGRLDLTQAEAIADLIHADSRAGMQVAVQQLRGKLFQQIQQIQEQIIQIASLVEAWIEFPEEEETFTHREDCLARLQQICAALELLLQNAKKGKFLRNGVCVALIGKPNVGKSSLLNALLQENRAIVTDIPGTTRDVIEEAIEIQGLAFRLLDTAGICNTVDPVEFAGIERSYLAQKKSDLTLLLLDGSMPLQPEDLALIQDFDSASLLLVWTKKDLWQKTPLPKEPWHQLSSVAVSAKTGQGLKEMEQKMLDLVAEGALDPDGQVWITNLRQQASAQIALDSLQQAQQGFTAGMGAELLAIDLRRGLDALGEIVGETTADDLLSRVFSEFCIGK